MRVSCARSADADLDGLRDRAGMLHRFVATAAVREYVAENRAEAIEKRGKAVKC